jgi:hypothetical protein
MSLLYIGSLSQVIQSVFSSAIHLFLFAFCLTVGDSNVRMTFSIDSIG